MTDVHSKEQRSHNMSRIRSGDTRPELIVRSLVHRLGARFRLRVKSLPGTPDLVFPGRRKVIFVHGCFWHTHQNCKLSRMPSTRSDFWSKKLTANVARDKRITDELLTLSWRVLVIWECHVRANRNTSELQVQLSDWIRGNDLMGDYPSRTREDSAS